MYRGRSPLVLKKVMKMNDVTEFVQSGATERLKSALSSLERKYEFASTQTDRKNFFLGVADYVEAICDTKLLSILLEVSIINERNELLEQRDRLTKLVIQEIEQTFDKLNQAIKKEKVELPGVSYELKEYASLVSGRTKSSVHIGQNLYDCVRDIIFALKQAEKTDLIIPFAKNKNSLDNTEWEISASYGKYKEIQDEVKRQLQISVWAAWEELWWVYASIHKQKELWNGWVDKGDQLNMMNASLLFVGMNDILEDREPKNKHFDTDKFKGYLSRFHNKFLDEGSKMLEVTKVTMSESGKLRLEDPQLANEPISKISPETYYSARTGRGSKDGKTIRFVKNKKPFSLFNALLKARNNELVRSSVMEVLGLKSSDNNTFIARTISDVVCQIRKTTHLSQEELVLNNGDITLSYDFQSVKHRKAT